MSANVTPWETRVPTPSNVADEPLGGEVEVLANQGLARVDPSKEFDDIFGIIAELAAKGGSVKMHGLDVEATV